MRWLLVIAFVLIVPAHAAASSCVTPLPELQVRVWPNRVDVPTNSRIWVELRMERGGYTGTPEDVALIVEGPSGRIEPGDVDVLEVARGRAFSYQFDEPLEADSAYLVEVRDSQSAFPTDAEPLAASAFTTGSGPSSGPPGVPLEVDRRAHSDSYNVAPCGGYYYDWVRFDMEAADTFLVLGADGERGLDGPGELSWVDGTIDLTTGTSLELTGDTPATSVEVAFGALDLSGGFSGWSEPTTATYAPAGWTCDTAAARNGSTSLPLLLVVVLRRRT